MTLNRKQKAVILSGLILIFASLVFPPFAFFAEGTLYERKYALLLSPPSRGRITYSVDSLQLFTQVFAICALVTGASFLAKD